MSDHIEKILNFISETEVTEVAQRTGVEIQEIVDIEYILSFIEQLRDRDRSKPFTWSEETHIAEQNVIDEKLKASNENLKTAKTKTTMEA